MSLKSKYNLCVIGGGPAGMMAAISASLKGKRVVLLEKNKSLGAKLLLTGGGKCNLTHTNLSNKDFVSKFQKQGDFLLSPLSVFGVKETMEFFKELPLKVELDGRVFPKSEKARDVLDFFKKKLKENKVKVLLGVETANFQFKDGKIEKIVLRDKKEIFADNFLIATGGKAYGYELPKSIGHTITELKPALSPVQTKEKWVSILKGLSLRKVGVSLNKNKSIKGDVLFTHFGLSGPLILNLSERIKPRDKIFIDLFPDKSIDDLNKDLLSLFEKDSKKTIKNILSGLVSSKLLDIVLNFSGINKDQISRNIKKEERRKLVKNLKKIEFNVVTVLGFEKAMVTKGGVSLKEIDSKTMQSKIMENLYFAGEVIDLNGETGGFNLQMCFTTGFVAGKSIF